MCPPGVDQTERMGVQYWNLLAPKLLERLELTSTKSGGDLLDFAASAESTSIIDAFHKLARPQKTASATSKRSHQNNLSSSTTTLSALETLPAELLALILADGTLSKAEVITFGSCSRTLWSHVLRHIQDDCRKAAGPWAGTPLIVTGNWLLDLPESIHREFPEGKELERQWAAGIRGFGRRGGMCPARRWNHGVISTSQNAKFARQEWLEAGKWLETVEDLDLLPEVSMSLEEAVSVVRLRAGDKWIFRNLSTREFVRLVVDKKTKGTEKAVVEGVSWLSLDQLLFGKTCWSRNQFYAAGSMAPKPPVSPQGEWAGHAFDVVCEADHVAEGWKDGTETALQQAKAVFSAAGHNGGW